MMNMINAIIAMTHIFLIMGIMIKRKNITILTINTILYPETKK